MKSAVNKRLKQAIDAIDATLDEIADATGISRSTWIRAQKDGAEVKVSYLESLSSNYGTDIVYILTGQKSVTTWSQSSDESVATLQQPVPGRHTSDQDQKALPTLAPQKNDITLDWDPEEFVTVRFYPEVYASGGQGLVTDNERSLPITFRHYFFNNTIQASPSQCFMIRIKGDSMNPLYPDGSDLLIDTARKNVKEGPGFLVRIDDSIYCKLLRKIPGGSIEVRSKNEEYQPMIIDGDVEDFEIIGEVVWHALKSKYI